MKKIKVLRKNYSTISLNKIMEWRDRLKFFDFSITWEDGDFFFLNLVYKNKSELLLILEKFGIILNVFPENYEKKFLENI